MCPSVKARCEAAQRVYNCCTHLQDLIMLAVRVAQVEVETFL